MFAAALLALTLSAEAGSLTVDWNKPAPVRYRAEVLINTPRGFRYLDVQNMDGRALQTAVSLDTSCTGAPLGKGFSVVCTIDRFAIQGVGDGNDQPRLDQVMASYNELMAAPGVQVEMELKPDGTVRVLDLEGIDKSRVRGNEVAEQLRQLMRRTFAAMSVSMPKDGEGAKPWKAAGMPMFYELQTMVGTTGGVAHRYEVKERGETIFITGEGKGNVSSQNGVGVGAYAMSAVSQARFDPALGLLAYAEFATTGNAGNQLAQAGTGVLYTLSGWIGRINADGTVETLNGAAPLQ